MRNNAPRQYTAAQVKEFVAEAIMTRRRPVSVMVFLPERTYPDQEGGD